MRSGGWLVWVLQVTTKLPCSGGQSPPGLGGQGGAWRRRRAGARPASDARVATAVGGAGAAAAAPATTAGGPRGRGRRGAVFVAGLGVVVLVHAQADVALERGGSQPLLGQAALEEGDAGAEVGQPVHPARNLPPAQQLEKTQDTHVSCCVHTRR